MGDGQRKERILAFVLYPGVTLLDLVGPLEVLSKIGAPYRAVAVGETLEPAATSIPVKVVPDRTFDDVPEPYAVIVPGGSGGAIRAMADERLREYLVTADRTAEVMGAVCTGSLVLAATGLLDGREATTHYAYAPYLQRLGARFADKRWVRDGRYITSAGVSAGIDMALALTSQLAGEGVARKVQIGLEYDPHPPLGPIDWSAVDRGERRAWIESTMRDELARRPDLLRRLGL